MTQTVNTTSNTKPNTQASYRPTFSPEHGVYVVLLVSFLIGAAAAQNWTVETTLALVCAFCGFPAEHPLVLQIKQRHSLKPRFLIWGGVYAVISSAIALFLYLNHPLLLWIYAGAIAALVVDAFSVLHREQKSVFNELITFAAVCLSTQFAYAATTNTISLSVMGLWALNTLFFSCSIFTVKLRKPKTSSLIPAVVYHAMPAAGFAYATIITFALYWLNLLSPVTVLAFGVALLKFGIIALNQEWYRNVKIQFVAMLETGTALAFLTIVALSILPARLIML